MILLLRFWWAPVIVGLALGLFVTRGTLADLRAQVKVDKAQAAQSSAEAKAVNEARLSAAADTYAQRTAALQPVILRSVDKVTTYAQTPAGRAPCIAAERVQSIIADRDQLFAVTPASSAEPVPASPTLPYAAIER